MPERRRFAQTTSLEERLAEEAKRLRKQAQGTPPGIEREHLVRRARQAETTTRMTAAFSRPRFGKRSGPSAGGRTGAAIPPAGYDGVSVLRTEARFSHTQGATT